MSLASIKSITGMKRDDPPGHVCSDSLMRCLRKVNVRLAQKIKASAGGHSGVG